MPPAGNPCRGRRCPTAEAARWPAGLKPRRSESAGSKCKAPGAAGPLSADRSAPPPGSGERRSALCLPVMPDNDTVQETPRRTAGLPLAGLRIIELGHYIAAPFATRLLADLGAEVIKVEPPEGDPVRQWGARYKGSAPWWSVH